ncbi:hypothetical protein ACFQ4O_15815, partial [Methylopila musalis]
MHFVLFGLGAVLLLWSAFLLLTGDMVATVDIAASLAGSGAIAIGLGAVVEAIARAARVVAAAAG